MPKTKEQKKQIIKNLEDKIEKSRIIIFSRFLGLKVNDINELRKECKNNNSEYYVSKKTLLERAFSKENSLKSKIGELNGEIALLFGYNDEIISAKILNEFNDKHKIDILGGVLENKFVNSDTIKTLANLPSKQELLSKLVYLIKSPISGMTNTLSGNIRGFINVLKNIKDKN